MFEVSALVGTLMWGYLSDLANCRHALVVCVSLALIIMTLEFHQHATSELMYISSVFAGNRGPMNLLFASGIFLSVAALWLMPMTHFIFQSAALFCIGFFVFGPQMLIGMAAAECSHKDSAGAATGFVGLFAYMGAALAGYPLAMILETYHWNGFFITIALCASVIGLLLLPFLLAQLPKAE